MSDRSLAPFVENVNKSDSLLLTIDEEINNKAIENQIIEQMVESTGTLTSKLMKSSLTVNQKNFR